MLPPPRLALAIAVAGIAGVAAAEGIRHALPEAPRSAAQRVNPGYNGRFTFTRIIYNGVRGFGRSSWNHDYPSADHNLPSILDFTTTMKPNLETSNVVWLSDPELFKSPIIYISEPGTWGADAAEIQGLRNHLLKGGFAIFDDFEADQWYNFEAQLKRALPEHDIVQIPFTHPIFHSFFDLDTVDLPHPLVRVTPSYWGVFEDNDPAKRLMVMICYDSDVAEFWEFAGTGRFPMNNNNDAFKLGVNFIIYALTH